MSKYYLVQFVYLLKAAHTVTLVFLNQLKMILSVCILKITIKCVCLVCSMLALPMLKTLYMLMSKFVMLLTNLMSQDKL